METNEKNAMDLTTTAGTKEREAQLSKENDDNDLEIEIEKPELKRELNLVSGISFIVGCIIGSGIFVSPKGVLDATGSVGLSLLVWAGAGLIALMGSLCYSELGTLIPKSGGDYTYIREAFGDLPAFLSVWVSIALMRPAGLAIMSLTFGTYFAAVFDTCGAPETIVKMAAVASLMTIMLINCYSVKMSANLQIVTTVTKVAALVIIIVGGIYRMIQGDTKVIKTGFSGSVTEPSTIALAFYDASWAYDGWNNLNYATEELRKPEKNLLRANIGSAIFVICIYLLTNLAYLTVMTKSELLGADAVAVLWGERVLNEWSIIIPLAVMISTFGSANAVAFTGGRTIFAASRDGNLPDFFSYIHITKFTPLPCMAFSVTLAIVFVLLGEIYSLIDFLSFTAWITNAMTMSALVYFRYQRKDAARPYKVPIVLPIVMIAISIYLVVAPIVQDPAIEFLYATLFILGGAIFYLSLIHFKLKIPCMDGLTSSIQLVFEVVPPSKYID